MGVTTNHGLEKSPTDVAIGSADGGGGRRDRPTDRPTDRSPDRERSKMMTIDRSTRSTALYATRDADESAYERRDERESD